MSDLTSKKCIPCSISVIPLNEDEIELFLSDIDTSWEVIKNEKIEREFKFKNFKEALEFTNKVGEIAESEGHHPDICLSWGKVIVTLWTHKIKGLHENDFIMAAKIDSL